MPETVLAPLGLELRATALADLDPDRLRLLLAEHGVVVLRDQDLDDAGFVAYLGGLGRLTFTVGETPVAGFPDLNVISNVGRSTPPRSSFHTDTSYVAEPPSYTALRAVQVPAQGGQTLFADQYAAYDTLPAETKDLLAGRTITHVVTGLDLGPEAETSAEHPVFRPHPLSGRTALYLSTPARCVAVSGMDDAQAAETVAALYAHATRPEITYRHAWAPGDVVLWDNGCVLHRADHEGVVGDRVMHRGMVTGYGTSS